MVEKSPSDDSVAVNVPLEPLYQDEQKDDEFSQNYFIEHSMNDINITED